MSRQASGAAFFNPHRSADPVAIKRDLASPDTYQQICAIKTIIANMTIGKDMTAHFNDVAILVGSSNLEIKKLVYLYLIQNAKSQPEKAVLQVGTFVQDTRHESPLIRGIALRTMSSMLVNAMVDFLHEPLLRGLRDSDPYVRRNAAFGVLKLYTMSPSVCEEVGLLEVILELLNDSVAQVVAAAVCAISEMLQLDAPTKLAVAVASKATTLLAAINECSEWSQLYLLEGVAMVFSSKIPSLSLDDAEPLITRCLPQLQSSNPAVVAAVIKVIVLFLVQFTGPNSPLVPLQQATLESKYAPKIAQPLVSLVSGVRFEIRYVALRNIKIMLQRFKDVLIPHLNTFFVKYDDPIYIKLEKIDIMMALATNSNGDLILSELVEYSSEVDVELVRKAVNSIGILAVKLEAKAAQCVERLVVLIKSKINYIVQEAAIVVQTILRQYPRGFEAIIGDLCEALDVIDDAGSKAAVAWVVGEYSANIENAAEILALFLDTFPDEALSVQLAVLTAVAKLFLRVGNEANQAVLEKTLELATRSPSPDLRDRAYFYWRLILQDPQGAQKVLFAAGDKIVETPLFDKTMLQLLLTQVGTVASVFYKPHQAIFGEGHAAMQVHYDDADEQDMQLGDTPAAAAVGSSTPAAGTSTGGGGKTATSQQQQQQQPAAPMRSVLDDLDFGPANPVVPLAGDPLSPISAGISALQPQPPAVPGPSVEYTTVLTGDAGKGFELAMAWLPTSTFPSLALRLVANTTSKLKFETIQLNVNLYGLGIAQDVPQLELYPKVAQTMTLLVNCNNRKSPNRDIQVAVKVEPLGVLFCIAPPVPISMMLQAATGYDAARYVEEFRLLQVAWQMPVNTGPLTSPYRLSASALRLCAINLIHSKEAPPLVGLHLFASTIAGQKLYAEVTVENDRVVIANVRASDTGVADLFGEYLLQSLAA